MKVDSYELGVRAAAGRVNFEASVYSMVKKDDILSYKYPDSSTETQNAGETSHRGIEVGLGSALGRDLHLQVAYSYAVHTFEEWSPQAGVDYAGKEISSAPREVGNVRLDYRPAVMKGGKVALEWERLGAYWMDDANTHKYRGHDVFNARAHYPVTRRVTVFGRVMNLTGERYATAAAYNAFRGEEFAPGMPRTVYAGLSYDFK